VVLRRPFALLLTPLVLALGMALTLATPVAGATDYPVRVVHNYCDGNTVHLKMRITARGYTNANKLTIDSWAQRRVSGEWQTVYNWQRAVYKFTINGDLHSLTSTRSYHGTRSHDFRIVFLLRAWHNQRVLFSTKVRSVAC
jgi:hypothetical protein